MTDDTRSHDTTRPDDWTGDDWARDEPGRQAGLEPAGTEQTTRATVPSDDSVTAEGTDRWNKTQWVGDRTGDGAGRPAPIDPDAMPEGDSDLSGFRHAPGEQHWGEGQQRTGRPDSSEDRLA